MIRIIGLGVRHYARSVLALFLLAFVVLAAFTAASIARQQLTDATAISSEMRTPEGVDFYSSVSDKGETALRQLDGVVSIADVESELLAKGSTPRSLPVLIRYTNREFPPVGLIVQGHEPRLTGEIVLSKHLAGLLDIEVGENVFDGTRELTVVGLIVDPAARDALLASAFASNLEPASINSWASKAGEGVELPESLTSDVHVVSGIDASFYNLQGQVLAPELAAWILYGIILAGLAMLSVLVVILRAAFESDAKAVVEAGLSAKKMKNVEILLVFAVLLSGGVLGIGAGWLATYLARDLVSGLWNQVWFVSPHWVFPVEQWLAAAIVVMAAPLVIVGIADKYAQFSKRGLSRKMAVIAVSFFASGLSSATAYSLFGSPQYDLEVRIYHSWPFIALCLAVASAPAIYRVRSLRSRNDSLRKFVRSKDPVTAPVVILLIAILFASSFRTGWATHVDAVSAQDEAYQHSLGNPGSLTIAQFSGDNQERLSARVESLGIGNSWFVNDPEPEVGVYARVMSPTFAECHAKYPTEFLPSPEFPCPKPTSGTFEVNGVAVDLSSHAVLANPNLIENGQVAVVYFDEESGLAIPGKTELVDAVADRRLGGWMPGMVMPVENALGLIPSRLGTFYLEDYATLSHSERTQIRGLARQLSPAATLTESQVADTGVPQRARVSLIAGLIALAVLLGMHFYGFGVTVSALDLEMRQAGALVKTRNRVVLGMFVPLLFAPIVALGSAMLAQTMMAKSAGVRGDFGSLMYIPPLMAYVLILGALSLRLDWRQLSRRRDTDCRA